MDGGLLNDCEKDRTSFATEATLMTIRCRIGNVMKNQEFARWNIGVHS